MALFTSYRKKNLTELLSHAVNKQRVLTLTALHGFLFGLAITPVPIFPREWLPAVFGEELLDAHNKLVELNDEKKLVFPFDIPSMSVKEMQFIEEWCYGFFNVQLLRPDVWILSKDIEGFNPKGDVIDITACSAIVVGAAVPEKSSDFFNQTRMKESFAGKTPREVKERLFALLPTAIATLQIHACAIKSGLVPKPRRVLSQDTLIVPKSDSNYNEFCDRAGHGKRTTGL
jgi:Uncharacterised protein family (UPF0149)